MELRPGIYQQRKLSGLENMPKIRVPKYDDGDMNFDSDSSLKATGLTSCWIFYSHIGLNLEFTDSIIRDQYYLFRVASTSPFFVLMIAILITFCYITYWTLVFNSFYSVPALILAIFSFIFAIIVLWLIAFLRLGKSLIEQQFAYRPILVALESLATLGITTTVGFVLVFRALRVCDHFNYDAIWACAPSSKCRGIPGDVSLVLLFFPYIFFVIFPFLSIYVVFISELIAFFFVIFCASFNSSYLSSSWIAVSIVISLFILVLYRLQSMELFLYTIKYYQVMKQKSANERRLAEKLSNEMRCLISSVSHDLKSPLSAFIQGFEGLKESMTEFTKNLQILSYQDDFKNRKAMMSGISFMKNTINSLVGTYQILLMTINRCTDYTKISHHIPLTPTLETVQLIEAITTPITCVSDLQGKICVELEMMDTNLAEYIITDRQWLQDNLLCLVSNAVKFSAEGTTSVRVFLTTFPSQDALNHDDGMKEENPNYGMEQKEGDDNDIREDDRHSSLEKLQEYSDSVSIRRNHVMIRFEVEDHGIGIEQTLGTRSIIDLHETQKRDELKEFFNEPDFAKREVGGSGLGLHCLSRRVEALQGEYGINPRRDGAQGTLIWFTIPYVPANHPPKSLGSVKSSQNSADQKFFDAVTDRWFENEAVLHLANYRRGSLSSSLSLADHSDLRSTLRRSLSADKNSSRDHSEKGVLVKKPSFKVMVDPAFPEIPRQKEDDKDSDESLLSSLPPPKPHVLVVDDSIAILKMLKIQLEKNGYKVTTAANGKEAVESFERFYQQQEKQTSPRKSDGIKREGSGNENYKKGLSDMMPFKASAEKYSAEEFKRTNTLN
eukprot:gene7072-7635_t